MNHLPGLRPPWQRRARVWWVWATAVELGFKNLVLLGLNAKNPLLTFVVFYYVRMILK